MEFWNVQKIAQACQGKIVRGDTSVEVLGFSTDSRVELKGQAFVCLKGENFDAHDFISQAAEKGAAVVITHRNDPAVWSKLPSTTSVVLVTDTLKALQDLGSFRRQSFNGAVIGITGSNGKSSTKEFCKAIIGSKFKVHASPGSFNNHWGVPISILSMPMDTEVLILEMGMSALGEIRTLCEIGSPTISVVTMVGSSHIGELGSQENIAKAKAEIYEASSKDSTFVFNIDNEWTQKMFDKFKSKCKVAFTFSAFNSNADCTMRALKQYLDHLEVEGSLFGVKSKVSIPVFGRHNVVNLMAASALAKAVGLTSEEIWKALPSCKTSWGRNQLVNLPNGARVLFDGYNANPESMQVLIRNFFETDSTGKKVAVLADMLELGEASKDLHFELGKLAGEAALDSIWFYGERFEDFKSGVESTAFKNELLVTKDYEQKVASKLGSSLSAQDVAIIKGSRGMKMERVLKDWYPDWKSSK